MWTGSNHDISRLATRWGDGDPGRTRAALVLLLTLRGTPVLYQGDEIGLVDGALTQEDLRDPIGLQSLRRSRVEIRNAHPCRGGRIPEVDSAVTA